MRSISSPAHQITPSMKKFIKQDNKCHITTRTSVFEEEVLVTPLFEARVVGPIMLVASDLKLLVEMCGVFVEQEVGRQIGPTAEPTHLTTFIQLDFKEAEVEVRRRHVGVELSWNSRKWGEVARVRNTTLLLYNRSINVTACVS